jgi:hypothetical protein
VEPLFPWLGARLEATARWAHQIALADRMLRAFSDSVEALKERRGLIVLAIEQNGREQID